MFQRHRKDYRKYRYITGAKKRHIDINNINRDQAVWRRLQVYNLRHTVESTT